MSLRITTRCHYAERHVLFIVILNVVILNVVMLNVVMLNVVMLSLIMLNVAGPSRNVASASLK